MAELCWLHHATPLLGRRFVDGSLSKCARRWRCWCRGGWWDGRERSRSPGADAAVVRVVRPRGLQPLGAREGGARGKESSEIHQYVERQWLVCCTRHIVELWKGRPMLVLQHTRTFFCFLFFVFAANAETLRIYAVTAVNISASMYVRHADGCWAWC